MDILKDVTGSFSTNVYLVYEGNKGFIIDPGEKSSTIEKYIDNNNIKIEFILLTHGHFDHISSVDYYREKYKAPVYGGIEEKELFMDPNLNCSLLFCNKSITVKIDREIHDGEIFSSFKIKAIHTPGHTSGGYSYVVGDKMFTGDTLFFESIGRSDLPTGNLEDLIFSVQNKLFTYSNKTVYPGHGSETNIDYEKIYNPYVN